MYYEMLKNPEYQKRYNVYGFVVIPGFYKKILPDLRALYDSFEEHKSQRADRFATTLIQNRTYRQKAVAGINRIVKDTLQELFIPFQFVYSNFLAKRPARKTDFHLHQDLTYVDESKYRAYNVWSPLTVSTRQNGCLEFIAGSNAFLNAQRGRNLAPPTDWVENDIDRFMTPAEMQPGDIVIFDTRIFHRSLDNLSDETRTAVSTIITHPQAQLIHLVAPYKEAKVVKALHVDEDFFTEYGIEEPIEREYPSEEIPSINEYLTLKQFSDIYYSYHRKLKTDLIFPQYETGV